jgi:ketosteroid isomerase-like protein
MIDEIAIQQTLNRYTEGVGRDWEQTVATFLPDGVWDIAILGKRFQGHAEIRQAMKDITASLDYILQINSPSVIVVNGDIATARNSFREYGKFSGKDESLEILGYYADQLKRTPEGWRFIQRVCTLHAMHHVPLLHSIRQTAQAE